MQVEGQDRRVRTCSVGSSHFKDGFTTVSANCNAMRMLHRSEELALSQALLSICTQQETLRKAGEKFEGSLVYTVTQDSHLSLGLSRGVWIYAEALKALTLCSEMEMSRS